MFEHKVWARTRLTAAEFHFKAPIGIGRDTIGDHLPDLLDLADIGLKMRGQGEEALLDPVRALIFERRHPAAVDQILAFREGGIERLVKDFAYRLPVGV